MFTHAAAGRRHGGYPHVSIGSHDQRAIAPPEADG
jgi:hypothetical protein